jgi:signal transduction histidine kinase
MILIEGPTSAIYTEQVDTVFRQMPIALAVNIVNAGLTAVALVPFASQPLPLPWLASVLLVTMGRLALWTHHRRTSASAEKVHHYARLATAGSLLAGLTWGIGGALLFPMVPIQGQIFLIMVIGGMCAGTVVVSASHLPTLLAFLWAATLPIAIRLVVEGATTNTALGAMIAVFAAALSLAGKHFNRIVVETMRLRVDLNETTRQLHIEMAERQAAEATLHQAQRIEALGQLTGGVAHDFNNLLTVVIGNIDLIGLRPSSEEVLKGRLKTMRAAAERGAMLTSQLLAFARRQPLLPRPVDLNALVTGMHDLLQSALGARIKMVLRSRPDLWPAMVDPTQIELVILNLVINARDAIAEGGTVILETDNVHRRPPSKTGNAAEGDYVVVRVIDNGKGMTPEVKAKAFEPFFTTKGPGAGSGLGLSQVYGTATQSGGDVEIESVPDLGTTVSVFLPRAAVLAEQQSTRLIDSTDERTSRSVVLLVDDDNAVRGTTAEILENLGYSVIQAPDGEAALEFLERGEMIDVLLTDVVMPGVSGPELARYARVRRPLLPIVFISGYADSVDFVGEDLQPLVRKPFRAMELREKIEAALSRVRAGAR